VFSLLLLLRLTGRDIALHWVRASARPSFVSVTNCLSLQVLFPYILQLGFGVIGGCGGVIATVRALCNGHQSRHSAQLRDRSACFYATTSYCCGLIPLALFIAFLCTWSNAQDHKCKHCGSWCSLASERLTCRGSKPLVPYANTSWHYAVDLLGNRNVIFTGTSALSRALEPVDVSPRDPPASITH